MAGFEGFGAGSAWVWMGISAAFAAAELAMGRRELLAGALAALLTAVAAWLAPALGPAVEAGIFALLGLALVAIGRALAGSPAPMAASLVGREAEVVAFDFHEGRVRIDGVEWPARLDGNSRTPRPGDRLRVVAADGRVVWVRPLPSKGA